MVNEFDMAAAIKSLMTGEARSAPMDAAFITDEFVFLDDARLGAADGPSTAGITEHEASNGVTGDANTTGASFETDISDLSVPKGALQNGANLEDGDRDLQVAARDGEVVSALSNSTSGPGGATTGGTSGGTPATSTGAATASPFVINVTWDASVGNAPAGFKTAVMSVVQYFESQFTDHVTINIAVG